MAREPEIARDSQRWLKIAGIGRESHKRLRLPDRPADGSRNSPVNSRSLAQSDSVSSIVCYNSDGHFLLTKYLNGVLRLVNIEILMHEQYGNTGSTIPSPLTEYMDKSLGLVNIDLYKRASIWVLVCKECPYTLSWLFTINLADHRLWAKIKLRRWSSLSLGNYSFCKNAETKICLMHIGKFMLIND